MTQQVLYTTSYSRYQNTVHVVFYTLALNGKWWCTISKVASKQTCWVTHLYTATIPTTEKWNLICKTADDPNALSDNILQIYMQVFCFLKHISLWFFIK